jgi:O-acetylhomoserine (thiol)-lyase
MEKHSSNAAQVAQYLLQHPKVTWVNYPGLPDHPSYEIAKKYFDKGQFSSLLGFGVEGGAEAGKKVVESAKLFSHVANLGDAKSLIIHPATTTHAQLTAEEQATTGVTDDFVRLSIGLEDVTDLIADLDQALAQI